MPKRDHKGAARRWTIRRATEPDNADGLVPDAIGFGDDDSADGLVEGAIEIIEIPRSPHYKALDGHDVETVSNNDVTTTFEIVKVGSMTSEEVDAELGELTSSLREAIGASDDDDITVEYFDTNNEDDSIIVEYLGSDEKRKKSIDNNFIPPHQAAEVASDEELRVEKIVRKTVRSDSSVAPEAHEEDAGHKKSRKKPAENHLSESAELKRNPQHSEPSDQLIPKNITKIRIRVKRKMIAPGIELTEVLGPAEQDSSQERKDHRRKATLPHYNPIPAKHQDSEGNEIAAKERDHTHRHRGEGRHKGRGRDDASRDDASRDHNVGSRKT